MRTQWGRCAVPFLTMLVTVAMAGGCASPDDDGNASVEPIVEAPSTPRVGGRVVVGTGAESDGFLPTINRWSPPTFLIARAVYDPLATVDENGISRPYLAESFTPNPAFTQWTVKLRPGVTFHDGTALTADALEKHFQSAKASVVTKDAISSFERTTVADPLTWVIDLKVPWAHMPVLFSSQLGYLPAPKMYDPGNTTAASNPVGTGPFKFTNWRQNDRLIVDRNTTYWRKDRDGRQPPYLSQVEFRPVVDDNVRSALLRSGELDVMHTQAYKEVSAFQTMTRDEPNGRLRALIDDSQGAEAGIVLNVQGGVFKDRNLRLAAAYAIDRKAITEQMFNGFYEVANGPYTKESRWGTAREYPEYMPAEARRLVEAWKSSQKSKKAPVIRFTNIAVADSVPIAQRIAKWWTDAGFEVKLASDEEKVGTVTLVTGGADAVMLRFWDRADPDGLYTYLSSDSIPAKSTDISLNFARYSSKDVVDPALKAARGSADDGFRRQQYQKVWDDFAQNLPIIFLFHTRWAFGYQEKVHGVGDLRLPDGSRAEPVTWGHVYLSGVWID